MKKNTHFLRFWILHLKSQRQWHDKNLHKSYQVGFLLSETLMIVRAEYLSIKKCIIENNNNNNPVSIVFSHTFYFGDALQFGNWESDNEALGRAHP